MPTARTGRPTEARLSRCRATQHLTYEEWKLLQYGKITTVLPNRGERMLTPHFTNVNQLIKLGKLLYKCKPPHFTNVKCFTWNPTIGPPPPWSRISGGAREQSTAPPNEGTRRPHVAVGGGGGLETERGGAGL